LKDLEIYVTGGNQLIVKGERKPCLPEKGVWHRQERAFGAFHRSLTLPFAVDADKVEARLENGVLRLQLTKHESAKPRKIPVKAE
jgi:HSP20 family protein